MTGVLRATGVWLMCFAALTFPFAIIASVLNDFSADGFWLSFTVSLFVGGAMWLSVIGRKDQTDLRDGLLFLVLAWILTPIAAAIPFHMSPLQPDLSRAYFEAVSALTTTGFKPFFAGNPQYEWLILWWNFLQWIGGFANLVAAIVVLASLNLTGPGVHRSVLFTLDRKNVLSRLLVASRIALIFYLSITIIVVLSAMLAGTGLLSSLCIGFASLATGGLLLADGSTDASSIPLLPLVIASLGMIIGATSFSLHWDAARHGRWRTYFVDEESRFFVLLLLFAMLASLLLGSWQAGEGVRAVLSAISLATSAGWDMGPIGIAAIPVPLILMFAFIGGSPVSTAGGLKVVRLAILTRHVGAELRRLAHPSSVAGVQFRERRLRQRSVMGLLLYVLAYTAAIGLVAMGSAAGGGSLDVSLAAATAAVGNLGPALTFAAPGEAAPLLSNPVAQSSLCVGMIAGRMEILGLIALFLPVFWEK
jgi:trk system potassium uptake protein TrkH